MPVKKSKRPPHFYEVRFWLSGREVRRSAGTHDKRAAEEYEERLRSDLWRQNKLGEKRFTWDDAIAQLKVEDSHLRSWERTERALEKLRMLQGAPLSEITHKNILAVREFLSRQQHRGERVKASSVNRILAVLRIVLKRAASHEWKMLDAAPKVPLLPLPRVEPTWGTREQVRVLLTHLAEHSADMAMFACATGMRKSEVTHIEKAHVSLANRTLYVPAAHAKNGRARVVPLNDEAIAILEKWMKPRTGRSKHAQPQGPHARYVFYFRGRAPIKQLSTRAWREACAAAGIPGFRFHDLRHTWASWHAQGGTPLQVIQELGGWLTFSMVQRYAHLSPGHLAQYADRSLIGEADAQKPEQSGEQEKRRA
jgi:integrase